MKTVKFVVEIVLDTRMKDKKDQIDEARSRLMVVSGIKVVKAILVAILFLVPSLSFAAVALQHDPQEDRYREIARQEAEQAVADDRRRVESDREAEKRHKEFEERKERWINNEPADDPTIGGNLDRSLDRSQREHRYRKG